MKITCDREKLLRSFQTAASVAPTRSPKQILQNVKLDATPESVILTSTDLEVGIRIDVSGFDMESPGSVVLPIDRFGSILRESSDEKIWIENDDTRVLVHGQRSKFQLPSQNPDEYPNVSSFEEESYHELSARFFCELIRRTVFATETESSHYALGGVLIELSEDEIIGVATDGRRLAKQAGPAKAVAGSTTGSNTTIIPSRALHLIERALTDDDENILLAARENDVLVKSQRATIYARLVEGRFPNWRGVFPKLENVTRIDLTVGPFYAAVRQAAIVTSDERRGVNFLFGDGRILLTGHGAEMGESHVELPISYDGPEIQIKLDPRFLNDFLKVLDPERMFTFELKDSETAAVSTTDDGYAYLVMPLAQDK